MIFTPETSIDKSERLAAISLILRSIPASGHTISLAKWIDNDEFAPLWMPLATQRDMAKVMPISPCINRYPNLFHRICDRLSNLSEIEWQGKYYEVSAVETYKDNLFAIQLDLSHSQSLPEYINRAIHGTCLQWFANSNPNLAEAIHQSTLSPFTIAANRIDRRSIRLKITVLTPELLSPLLWGLHPYVGNEISVTDIPCRLSPQIQISASSRYESLTRIVPQTKISLEFSTPTSFKHEDFIQLFPSPEFVFGSLLRRWNTFAPEQLKFEKIDWHGMVADYNLKTQSIKMKANEKGSIGWVRYEFPNPEQARIATILAHFAEFAGVGRKTAMGMGQVRLKTPKYE